MTYVYRIFLEREKNREEQIKERDKKKMMKISRQKYDVSCNSICANMYILKDKK